jgi:hypothetical protein
MRDRLTWRDHLNHASGFANLVTVAAAKVPDPEIQGALLATAKVIGDHIAAGAAKAEAEIAAWDPGDGTWRDKVTAELSDRLA